MIPRPVTGFREMKQSLFDIMATNLERSRLSQHGHTIRVVDTHRQRRLKLHGAGALYMTVSIKCILDVRPAISINVRRVQSLPSRLDDRL